ncbi:MAG: HDOD domain-containing protein [Campylobacterales bacterium]|nr:HDOD domain-containing protein [Campylobacterales bacterium]
MAYPQEKGAWLMISRDTIDRYIAQVPAIPKIVKACSAALAEGDLVKAADCAAQDSALMLYLREIVNKSIFGFRSEIKEPRQIFGVLGLFRARQILYSYYTRLLMPARWDVFDLDSRTFQELQAQLMVKWEGIMEALGCHSVEISKVASIIPATFAACEGIFKHDVQTLRLLQAQKAVSYEAILYKMSGLDFFDLACMVAQKWELSDEIIHFLQALKDPEADNDRVVYFKLLLQYELSRDVFMRCGINNFFELEIDASEEQIDHFYACVSKFEA